LNVLDNDELNGDPVIARSDERRVGSEGGTAPVAFEEGAGDPVTGVVLNPDGTVAVSAGTTAGTYTLDYTICEVLNPANCSDAATVTVDVIAAVIEAADDSGDDMNGYGGGTVQSGGSALNVLDNDELNGDPVIASEVTLKVGGTEVTAPVAFEDGAGDPVTGVVLNPDGTVAVSAGTAAGTYTLDYTICEVLNPANCSDAATV